MAHLSIRALGPYQVSFDSKSVASFDSEKVRNKLVNLRQVIGGRKTGS